MASVITPSVQTVGRMYGDLNAEDAIRIQQQMLPNVTRNLVTGRFAEKHTKEKNQGHIVRFKRYEKLPYDDVPLSEGVTPNFDRLDQRIVSTEMRQFGRFISLTDLMGYYGQDDYQAIASEQQAIQAAEQMEHICFKKFRAGANVHRVDFAGQPVTNRSQINGQITGTMILKAVRALEEEDSEKISEIVTATDEVSTSPIRASYMAVCHPHLRADLEAIDGFVPVEQYSNSSVAFPGEMGAFKGVRFIQSTIYQPWKGAGAAPCTSPACPMLSTNGLSDIYPIIIFAKNAVGQVSLSGINDIIPVLQRPDSPSKDDPLNQRGSIGYKYLFGCLILRDEFLQRLEVSVTEL